MIAAWASQIYQDSDAPGELHSIILHSFQYPTNLADFKRGNTINIIFSGIGVLLFVFTKWYYMYLNTRNARLWEAMGEEDKRREELEAEVKGNRSVTFRFTT